MPKRKDIETVLVIGSGPIIIGQACEFDYSGTQAVKALKEEGYRVVLINSNPATIMTDPNLADQTYIEPITPEFIAKVIERERPDVLLPTIGGQTALNATIALEEQGILQRYNVELIGANVEAIKKAEDRALFKEVVESIGLEQARSHVVRNYEEALKAKSEIGFPLIIRPSRTLGGSGGAIVYKEEEFEEKVKWGFEISPISELLLEESLLGWKELELEVMRDKADNGVIICGIENVDPMGLHTGDSITVAPIQTLTDKEYQKLRDGALRLLSAIGVDTGGSNVQYAIDPKTGRQIVIEMNPRVSRSSALASKATGFPIAKIAAKLAVGYTLDELPNDITKKTPASFEPSIDYVVVKIPRFTFEKFEGADETLGTQMKSVGEAMAIGRTFQEALQKACRSLETGRTGIFGGIESKDISIPELMERVKNLNPARLFQAARLIELGVSAEEINSVTGYDLWFLNEMVEIAEIENELKATGSLTQISPDLLRRAKMCGTSDKRLSNLLSCTTDEVKALRNKFGIRPSFKSVDTCAAEFEADTPYLYSTYDSVSDIPPTNKDKIIILGGGPNRIGQGIEFDYCCVHAAFSLKEAGFETIMVNCNPETVSTDYDTSDRLYFEPLTEEDIIEIVEREKPKGVIVQYGGQTPLKLSKALQARGVPIIGTSPDVINQMEDRELFQDLLNRLNLQQSPGAIARSEEEAHEAAKKIGFPLLIRPSFVLGGRAMAIINSFDELSYYIKNSVSASEDKPVLLDHFLNDAIEVDVDSISDGENFIVCGIVEHIERAGVHSGDSSFMLPSQTLSPSVISKIEEATKSILKECQVSGLMNVQFAVCKDEVYIIEVNPRASRSVPFVSKVTGIPWAKIGARVMAGETLKEIEDTGLYGKFMCYADYKSAISEIGFVGVKASVFPFIKFRGVDSVLGPEMRSTGEVMGIDRDLAGGFARAQIGTGIGLPTEGRVFVSLRNEDKQVLLPSIKRLSELGFSIVSTKGTAAFLNENGVKSDIVNKVRDGSPHIVDMLKSDQIDLVINTPEGTGPMLDSRSIRSTSVENQLPIFTTAAAALVAVDAIENLKKNKFFYVESLQEHLGIY